MSKTKYKISAEVKEFDYDILKHFMTPFDDTEDKAESILNRMSAYTYRTYFIKKFSDELQRLKDMGSDISNMDICFNPNAKFTDRQKGFLTLCFQIAKNRITE